MIGLDSVLIRRKKFEKKSVKKPKKRKEKKRRERVFVRFLVL